MSNPHAYHYFKSTPELLQQLFAEHQPIDQQRSECIAALMKAHNALGLSTQTGLDGVPYFTGLALPHDDPRIEQQEFTKVGEGLHNGKKIVYVRGRGNRKDGKAINQSISSANAEMKALPNFETWFLTKHQLQRSVMGGLHSSGRGFVHLISYLMSAKEDGQDVLLVCIPKEKDKPAPVMPDGFVAITAGQFIDLTGSPSDN